MAKVFAAQSSVTRYEHLVDLVQYGGVGRSLLDCRSKMCVKSICVEGGDSRGQLWYVSSALGDLVFVVLVIRLQSQLST